MDIAGLKSEAIYTYKTIWQEFSSSIWTGHSDNRNLIMREPPPAPFRIYIHSVRSKSDAQTKVDEKTI